MTLFQHQHVPVLRGCRVLDKEDGKKLLVEPDKEVRFGYYLVGKPPRTLCLWHCTVCSENYVTTLVGDWTLEELQ